MSSMQNFALCARAEKQPKAELESYRKTPQVDRTNIVSLHPHGSKPSHISSPI